MIYAGIDPGLKGGIACIGDECSAEPMPVIGGEIDVTALHEWLAKYGPDLTVVEQVHSMPKQGVKSTFTFGVGYGRILATLDLMAYPYIVVRPQEWKKQVLAGTAKDKDAAITFARRSFPWAELMPGKKRVPHDGIADALCLAEYGRKA